ncbi:MAG: ATP synthase subunit I, partial [Proteobacteria bacterium]|nr:ATP synthase subunit I [Pseudomonadota bacterium]
MILGQRVERFLYERGFEHPDVRSLMRTQVYLAVFSSLILLTGTALSAWALAYAAGALVVSVNFWYMAKAVQILLYVR